MELKTPLYDAHVKAGGKMVPFAGYILPVQYKAGVIKEHMAVRQEAGLFDVSHMGEILCEGEKALENLQHLLTNDFTNMVDGQARYSPMCWITSYRELPSHTCPTIMRSWLCRDRKQWRSFADLRRKTRSRRNTTTQYSTGKSAGSLASFPRRDTREKTV